MIVEPDVIVLTNGNIVIRIYLRTSDENLHYYEYYVEYHFDGRIYKPVTELQYSKIKDSDGLHEEYSINDTTVSESDFTDKINEFERGFSSVIFRNTQYGTDNLQSPSDRYLPDWESAALSTPDVSMTFDEVWEALDSYRD